MKRCALVFHVLVVVFALALPARGQFTVDEVAEWARWEAFLAEAPIVGSESVGEGVTAPSKLWLEKDGVKRAALWKGVHKKLSSGGLDSWKYEIAAYRLDRLIGLNMVPPAVERVYKGKKGALVLWINFQSSLLEIMEQGGRFPTRVVPLLSDWTDLYYVWGSLIANDDPTQQNIRYTADWRMILIDHSRAFRSDKAYTERLVFGANGIKKREADGKPFLFSRLPRALYERIKALDAESVRQAVGPYLTEMEIGALMSRRTILLGEIDGLIERNGVDKVLY